jgi:predicted dienelactone hydrolase
LLITTSAGEPDLAYREELLQGGVSSALSPMEYLDRPQDISYLLDELEKLAANDPIWQNKINFEQIGIIGESLGATTVFCILHSKFPRIGYHKEIEEIHN